MAERILIRGAQVYGPVEVFDPGWLLVDQGKIALMGPGPGPEFPDGSIDRVIDARGQVLLPGFIDLHVHGAVGKEVMDADPAGVRAQARFYAQHGVTGFLPTTWTAARKDIDASLQAVAQVMGRVEGGASVLGVHLEGPYLNAVKTGAQDASLIRRAGRDEALAHLDSGLVRLVTLAPEFPENLWLIDECVRRGVTAAAGHTTAGLEELREAAQRGLKHITHCFNAMQPLGHRDVGTVGAAMVLPTLHCELIADNIHVHPAAQKILIDVKTPAGVILVTDALRGTGLPDGEFKIDTRTVTIRGGAARLPDGTLAGSILTMERALKNAMTSSGRSLQEAWPMSSLNAAREIGLSHRKGSLEVGKDADLVLLDSDFQVRLTLAEGQLVYQG